jgi:hypothetical protein
LWLDLDQKSNSQTIRNVTGNTRNCVEQGSGWTYTKERNPW